MQCPCRWGRNLKVGQGAGESSPTLCERHRWIFNSHKLMLAEETGRSSTINVSPSSGDCQNTLHGEQCTLIVHGKGRNQVRHGGCSGGWGADSVNGQWGKHFVIIGVCEAHDKMNSYVKYRWLFEQLFVIETFVIIAHDLPTRVSECY